MDKLLILIGILMGSILVVENMIFNLSAYVLIWQSTTGSLALICLSVGGILGFGIRGFISTKSSGNDYHDDF